MTTDTAGTIKGWLSDGQRSSSQEAWLEVCGSDVRLHCNDQQTCYPLAAVAVSSRLGNTPRILSLPDGSRFETRDNDAIDHLLAEHHRERSASWLHRMESHLKYVLTGVLVVALFGWLMVAHGLPAAADHIARQLPVPVARHIGEQALEALNPHLQASTLPEARRQQLRVLFDSVVADADSRHAYELVFRRGGRLGANALALPSGTIIVTDELVQLAQHDEELVAILAHEVGHVEHRHGLRQVLQVSALGLIVTYTTGDVSTLVAALPVILLQMGYSRAFELEADRYAADHLRRNGIPVSRLTDLLQRLDADQMDEGQRHRSLGRYISTHPLTSERIEALTGDHSGTHIGTK